MLNEFLKQFERLRSTGYELPDLDAKATLYDSDAKGKSSLVKDLIAMANWSRRTGQMSFILFGVTDEEFELCDLRRVGDDRSLSQVQDQTANRWRNDLAKYVNQPITWQLGLFAKDESWHGLLIVEPSRSGEAYWLKKDLPDTSAGYALIRVNSESTKVSPAQIACLCSRSTRAYLTRQHWLKLVEGAVDDSVITEHTRLLSLPTKSSQDAFAELEHQVLAKPQNIVVVGPGGAGKSLLLENLSRALAQTIVDRWQGGPTEYGRNDSSLATSTGFQNDLLRAVDPDQLEVAPTSPVPILLRLRRTIRTVEDLSRAVRDQIANMSGYSLEASDPLDVFLDMPRAEWVFILDGVDEIRPQRDVGHLLRDWLSSLARYKNRVRCVLGTRQDALNLLDQGSVPLAIWIQKPERAEVLDWVKGLVTSTLVDQDELCKTTITHIEAAFATDGLGEMLRLPRWLDAYLEKRLPGKTPFRPVLDQFIVATPVDSPSDANSRSGRAEDSFASAPSLEPAIDPADGGDNATSRNQEGLPESKEDDVVLNLDDRVAQVVSDVLDIATRIEALRLEVSDRQRNAFRVMVRKLALQVDDWADRSYGWNQAKRGLPAATRSRDWWLGLGVLTNQSHTGRATNRDRYTSTLLHEVLAAEHIVDDRAPMDRLARAPADCRQRIERFVAELTPVWR